MMIHNSKHLAIVMLVTPMVGGCATVWPSKHVSKDVAEQRTDRKEELIQSFESKRDTAQFEAAMVRWREGDSEGCRELVDKLLARSPKHRGGRLLRAEFRLVEDRPELAVKDIEALVEEIPNDAEAAHLLGLLLEAAGHNDEALAHFERAVQIEPANSVFASSYQTALVGERVGQAFPPDTNGQEAVARH